MDIGFVFTNFNNSTYSRAAVESLMLSPHWESCRVVIVDNCSKQSERDQLMELKLAFPSIHVILNEENVGYFKGLNIGIDYLRRTHSEIELMVIGNNDLVFPADFTAKLLKNENVLGKFPVVSPDLITLDGIHQNPHVTERISRTRELIWDLYFMNYTLALAIRWVAKVTKRFTERKDHVDHGTACCIYQGYGACYVLGPVFFKRFKRLWAPTFLMGEEFFLSKQLESQNFQVFYDPSILVHHHDHACMDKLPTRRLWEITRESHSVYRKYVKPFQRDMNVRVTVME